MGRPRLPEKRAGKQQRSAESRRRAATVLAQLGWLAGFPDGDAWRRLDRVAPVALDGALIARSRRLGQELLREHREALRALVGDVDRWWAIIDTQLAWCTRRLRDGEAAGWLDLIELMPPRIARAARSLAAREPSLAGAIVAAASAWAHEPAELTRVLDWLAPRSDVLVEVAERTSGASADARTTTRRRGDRTPDPVTKPTATLADSPVATTMALARLALEDPHGVDTWIALHAVDAPHPQMSLEVVQNVKHRVDGRSDNPAPPPARSRPVVTAWLDKLAEREHAYRARSLAVLAASDLVGALAAWAAWERAHAGRLDRANAFAARDFDRHEEAFNHAQILLKLEETLKAAPPSTLAIRELLYDVDVLAGDLGAKAHSAVVRLLAALPASWDPVLRVQLLMHLAAHVAWLEELRPVWLWDAIAESLERGAPAGLLEPWRDGVVRSHRVYIEDELVEPLKKRAEIRRLVGVMARLATTAPVSKADASHAAAWIAAGLDDDRIVEIGAALRHEKLDDLEVPVARAAHAIAGDTIADLAAQTRALIAAIGDVTRSEATAFAELVEHLGGCGLGWLAREALAAKQGAGLAHVANILALLPRERWPVLATTPADARWQHRYPAALAPALARLALVDPDAEQTAARRLASDLPDPVELRRELAVLRARTDRSASANKRLANLEARLAAPKPPSDKRVARLVEKLDRTACAVGLDRLVAVVTACANERLVRALGLDLETVVLGVMADDAASRRTRELLFALLRLQSPERSLAGRLLRARNGPRPWDLRDDPANRAFLERLRERGVDPTAWLDDTPQTITVDNKPLVLALESDPLEVFAMGAHFQTCLSPSGGNFFSVVANAADINKRVLYARREGRVVGRCLLAITDGNALLAFNPYCHERIDFSAVVRDFALALAATMGVPLVPRGTVSTLLASDWYDDGPHDLVGRFGGLEDLRTELETIDPANLVDKLRAALGRDLDDVTLPIVVALHELSSRPELIVPLVPHLLASTTPSTRLRAAEIAMPFDIALADRLLGDHAAGVRLDDHPWQLGQLIATLRPSLALARLRATREVRNVRDDRGDRIAIAGVALAALHRPKQAAALFRLAMEKENWLEYEMRTRLAALGM